jgi:hypothetical protein
LSEIERLMAEKGIDSLEELYERFMEPDRKCQVDLRAVHAPR